MRKTLNRDAIWEIFCNCSSHKSKLPDLSFSENNNIAWFQCFSAGNTRKLIKVNPSKEIYGCRNMQFYGKNVEKRFFAKFLISNAKWDLGYSLGDLHCILTVIKILSSFPEKVYIRTGACTKCLKKKFYS